MKKICIMLLAFIAVALLSGAIYDTPYIGNSLRGTFHKRDCPSVWKMWQEHQVPLESREEAISKGFRPCGNCRP